MKKTKKQIILMLAVMTLALGTAGLSTVVTPLEVDAAATMSDVAVTMQDGASIRVPGAQGETYGLRFQLNLTDEYQTLLNNNVGADKAYQSANVGVVIAPTRFIDATHGLTEENIFGNNACFYYMQDNIKVGGNGTGQQAEILGQEISYTSMAQDPKNASNNVYRLAVKDIDVTNIAEEFTATGYLKLVDKDGAVDYRFASTSTSRSAAYVGQLAYEDTGADALDSTHKTGVKQAYIDTVSTVATQYTVYTYKQNVHTNEYDYVSTTTEDTTIGAQITAPDEIMLAGKTSYIVNTAKTPQMTAYANNKTQISVYYDYVAVELSTKQDVLDVLPIATGEKIVLKNDINFEGASYTTTNSGWFNGILDGHGYALQNMKIEASLFTNIDATGTIENIQIVDAVAGKDWRSVLASNASGVFRNMFVKASSSYPNSAGLFNSFRTITLTLDNIVVDFDTTANASAICANWNSFNDENSEYFVWNNVYVISDAKLIQNSDTNSDGTPITKIKKVTEAELIKKVQNEEIDETLASLIRKNYDCNVYDLTATTNYYVETGKYNGTSNGNVSTVIEGHTPVFNEQIKDNTSAIVSIHDGTTVIKADKDSVIDVNSLTKGVRTWTVKYENGDSYLVTVNVVNAILKTPSDVLTILPTVYDDYIVLGNDIDMTEADAYINGKSSFLGTFDGRGFAIHGLVIDGDTSGNALFKAGANFTMKNIALTGVSISGSWKGVIIKDGQATLENVFVEVTDSGSDNGLIGNVQTNALRMTNVAIVYNTSGGRNSVIANYIGSLTESDFTFENVYVLSTAKMYGDGASDFTSVERVADKQALRDKASDNAIKGSVLAGFIEKYVQVNAG